MNIYIEQSLFLSESLPDISDDVDLIFDNYFKASLKKVKKTGKVHINSFKKDIIDSSVFKTEKCREAHRVNPVKIFINYGSNNYQMFNDLINISVSSPALKFVSYDANGKLEKALSMLSEPQAKRLKNEFTEHRIKGSIRHEILHWIADSLYNNSLKKAFKKIQDRGKKRYFKDKVTDNSYIEIEAQMGNIQELKRKFSDQWDDMTFDEMIGLNPSLSHIKNKFTLKQLKQWKKDLKRRMHREGLLGKKMR